MSLLQTQPIGNTGSCALIKRIVTLLAVTVIACYMLFIYQYALNIPRGDDLTDILQVIIAADNAEDYRAFFAILWQQHNDHRTLSSRMVYWAAYKLAGEVNFRTLTILANFGLLLIFSMLVVVTSQARRRWLILLPAACLLFHLRAYQLMLWSMAAFAYFYVFVYGIASLLCLHLVNRAKFAAALILATLATFSLASGQVVWLAGLASLLHQTLVLKRISAFYLFSWIAASLVVLSAWRIGLKTPNTTAELFSLFLQTPLHHATYLLALTGSAVSDTSVLAASIAGALLFAVLLGSSVKHYRLADIRPEIFCWFVVLSVATMMLGRAPYTNLEYALASRYSFPSVLMLTCSWVLLAYRFLDSRPTLLLAGAIVAAVYFVSAYRTYSPALQSDLDRRVANFNRGEFRIFGAPAERTKAIVDEAVELGIYEPPERPYPVPSVVGNWPILNSSQLTR